MDLALILEMVPLGLAAALTPSLLALQVLVTSGDPWARRSLAVIVGNGLVFGVFCALVLLGLSAVPGGAAEAGGLIRIVGAIILAPLAVILLLPHPVLQARLEQQINAYVQRASIWPFFILAFVLSAKDLSSFVVLVPGVHAITLSTDRLSQAVAMAVLLTCALAPVLAPPAARLALGAKARRYLQAAYRFTIDHQLRIAGVATAAVCLFLLVTGLSMAR